MDVIERNEIDKLGFGEAENQMTCVMKFGGSSVACAERMREVADLILSFPNERPVIVLSAMGKTTNKLLLVGNNLHLIWLLFFFYPLISLTLELQGFTNKLVYQAGETAVSCGVSKVDTIEELSFIKELHHR